MFLCDHNSAFLTSCHDVGGCRVVREELEYKTRTGAIVQVELLSCEHAQSPQVKLPEAERK